MSAFLGPIHYWLYNKITFQDDLVKELTLKLGSGEVVEVDSKIGTMPKGNLQDIIESDNIHGWLQDKIHLVEGRLSFVVEALCQNGIPMDSIKEVAYEVGVKHSMLSQESTAMDAYKLLNDLLIDGMPCDHINELNVQEVNCVEWVRSRDIHQEYWKEESINEHRFDQIRDELIRGLLSTTKLTYTNQDNVAFSIKGGN